MAERYAELRKLRQQAYEATRRATQAGLSHGGINRDSEHVRALWIVARIAQEDHHAARTEVLSTLPITFEKCDASGYTVRAGRHFIGEVWKMTRGWIGNRPHESKVTAQGPTRLAVAVQLREQYIYGED